MPGKCRVQINVNFLSLAKAIYSVWFLSNFHDFLLICTYLQSCTELSFSLLSIYLRYFIAWYSQYNCYWRNRILINHSRRGKAWQVHIGAANFRRAPNRLIAPALFHSKEYIDIPVSQRSIPNFLRGTLPRMLCWLWIDR